ncbi:hypothetical protein GQ55_4G347500 [Panicum hallii var. hallii]|uniref:Uncharacterized protein n=1 Tax=Panicum hallii var. hallii TaxID=1504633 RepID=A0A2T7E399_9POAL|nr:hypothetical protein GQ55_4G347500 [Panicum hallii var. hallii]
MSVLTNLRPLLPTLHPALTLQEADAPSSSGQEEELLPSSEVTSSPGTLPPHSTTDGSSSSFPSSEEELAAGAAGSTSSEQLSAASPSSVLRLHATAEESSTSASFVGPSILLSTPPNWYQDFYMRTDRKGYLHMYPDLGGPFGSFQEAEAAINRYLDERRLLEICQKPSEDPRVEWLIKQALYYPDGTPKRDPNAPSKNSKDHMRHLVKALIYWTRIMIITIFARILHMNSKIL